MTKRVLVFSLVMSTVLSACGGDKALEASSAPAASAAVESTAAVVQPVAKLDASPVAGAVGFAAPLPEGVVFAFPHNVRLDVSTSEQAGVAGRRTEFEFFTQTPSAAMASVAESMAAAGFNAGELTDEGGVIRQTFTKEGYGTVNARAQLDANKQHPASIGFLVMAWPKNSSK